jgi:hypothetical protein
VFISNKTKARHLFEVLSARIMVLCARILCVLLKVQKVATPGTATAAAGALAKGCKKKVHQCTCWCKMLQELLCLLSLWAAVVAQHSVILQRFDFENDQTFKKNVHLYLHKNADDLAASACYELYFDTGVQEVNQCISMATHTIRDHMLVLAHATVDQLDPDHVVAGDHQNDVTSMALQYAHGSGWFAEQSSSQRVCYVGIPPAVDFLTIVYAEGVHEFVLYLSHANLPTFTPSVERVLEEMARSAGKPIVVVRDYMEVVNGYRSKLESLQWCDSLHFQRTPLADVTTALDALRSGRGALGAVQPRPVRVVLVRDIDMEDRLRNFPLVSAQGRQFAAHNATADVLLGPAGSTGGDLHSSYSFWPVRWLMFSVWVDRARMHAMSNYDGMTGRAFVTSRAPSADGAGVTQMQEVSVGQMLWPTSEEVRNEALGSAVTPAGEGAQVAQRVIAITYTIRVFGETAEGLKTALRSLGYRRVYVLPDMTLGALSFLCAENGRFACDNVLQIALGPHDFTMLLPRYVVFQMEQVSYSDSAGGNCSTSAATLIFFVTHRCGA